MWLIAAGLAVLFFLELRRVWRNRQLNRDEPSLFGSGYLDSDRSLTKVEPQSGATLHRG
jgi:hypothetical protein